MDLEWRADILIPERTVTVIMGPPQVVIEGLDHCSSAIRRYPLLYVCSNFSGILSCLHRTTSDFSVRRGFTSDQVSTIISECDTTYLFIEHDPSLYEEDPRLVQVVVNKIKAFTRESGTAIVYSHKADRFMHQMMRTADRVYLYGDWMKRTRSQALNARPGTRVQARTLPVQVKLVKFTGTGDSGDSAGRDGY
jgi:hypothetical protein